MSPLGRAQILMVMGSVLKTELHCTYIGNAWIQRILLRGDKKLEDNTVLMPVPRKQLYIYIYHLKLN